MISCCLLPSFRTGKAGIPVENLISRHLVGSSVAPMACPLEAAVQGAAGRSGECCNDESAESVRLGSAGLAVEGR